MPDYSKSQIYELSYDGYYYVGSTTQLLKKRLKEHQNDYKCYLRGTKKNYSASKYILEKCFDCNKHTIQFIGCKSKKELERKEREYIKIYKKKYGDMCVNVHLPAPTNEEIKIQKQNYRDTHKLEKSITDKNYKIKNKEKIQKKNKQYHINNREKRLKDAENYRNYTKTWGGDKRFNNNLLSIHPSIFQ